MSFPFVRIEEKNEMRIVYYRADSSGVILVGGTRTWRYHNPGNINYGSRAKEFGAIGRAGEGKGKFAIFPDEQTGRDAILWLFEKSDFQAKTIAGAIERWAPKKDKNNHDLYKRHVQEWTGLDPNRLIKDLSKKELEVLGKAIERKEGWREGKIDAVIATSRNGNLYLRTRPDPIEENLEDMG